jgi:hypothetical protein
MIDRYTKIVLTVIALILVVLVAKPVFRPECGGRSTDPCYVVTSPLRPLYITSGTNPIYVETKPGDTVEVTNPLGLPVEVEIRR